MRDALVGLDIFEGVGLDTIIDPTDIEIGRWTLRLAPRLPKVILFAAIRRRYQLDVFCARAEVQLLGHPLHQRVDRVHQVEDQLAFVFPNSLLFLISCICFVIGLVLAVVVRSRDRGQLLTLILLLARNTYSSKISKLISLRCSGIIVIGVISGILIGFR